MYLMGLQDGLRNFVAAHPASAEQIDRVVFFCARDDQIDRTKDFRLEIIIHLV